MSMLSPSRFAQSEAVAKLRTFLRFSKSIPAATTTATGIFQKLVKLFKVCSVLKAKNFFAYQILIWLVRIKSIISLGVLADLSVSLVPVKIWRRVQIILECRVVGFICK